jgi:hypothetical protein
MGEIRNPQKILLGKLPAKTLPVITGVAGVTNTGHGTID